MAQDNGAERRKHPRLKVFWKARITRANKQRSNARLDNVSRGGGHLILDMGLVKGESVLLELLPYIDGKARYFKLVATVAYVHLLVNNSGFGVGFAFKNPPEDLVALVTRLERICDTVD